MPNLLDLIVIISSRLVTSIYAYSLLWYSSPAYLISLSRAGVWLHTLWAWLQALSTSGGVVSTSPTF